MLQQAEGSPALHRDSASDFGTQAHIIFDELLQNKAPEVDKSYKTVVASFEKFLSTTGITIEPEGCRANGLLREVPIRW